MDVSQFEDHLDRYGADLSSWPAALRLEAAALMANSAPARAAFRAMGDVETLLRIPVASNDMQAMAARAMQHRQIRSIPVALRRAGWASAAAAALILGLAVGDLSPAHDDSPDHVMAAAFDMASTDGD